jgi:hypothetical protein
LRAAGTGGGGRQGVLRLLHDGREGRRVVHREVGEHLAVELDACAFNLHEARVRQSVRANARVTSARSRGGGTGLAVAAVAIRVHAGVMHLLLRGA